MRYPISRLLAAALFVLGGALLLGLAVREWNAYRPISSLKLPPDGRERRTPPLRSSARYEYRVVISGAFRGRFNGVTYDAIESFSPGEEPWPHQCLDLDPPAFIPAPASRPLRRVFVPANGFDLAGQPVVARHDPDRLTADMQLPVGSRDQVFEGELQLVVGEWDRRQFSIAAGLAFLGALLLTAGLLRGRMRSEDEVV
jgi:hypothetical protein